MTQIILIHTDYLNISGSTTHFQCFRPLPLACHGMMGPSCEWRCSGLPPARPASSAVWGRFPCSISYLPTAKEHIPGKRTEILYTSQEPKQCCSVLTRAGRGYISTIWLVQVRCDVYQPMAWHGMECISLYSYRYSWRKSDIAWISCPNGTS